MSSLSSSSTLEAKNFVLRPARNNANNGTCVAPGNRIICLVMRQSASKRKKLDYPEQTEGSRLAAKVRKLASRLTPEQEAEHFRRGMAKIYGGQPKEITGAGH